MPPRGTSRSPGRGGRTSQLAPAIHVVHSARGSRAGAGSGVQATRNSPNTALPRSPVGTTSTAASRTARVTRKRSNATSAIQPSPSGNRRTEGRRVNSTSWRARRTPSTDRKSTRLNSSHDQISYAVFCLKKKKKRLKRLDRLLDQVQNPMAGNRVVDSRTDQRSISIV